MAGWVRFVAGFMVAAAVAYGVYSVGRQSSAGATGSTAPQVDSGQPATGGLATAPTADVPRAPVRPFSRSEWGYRWDASNPGVAANAADAAWLESRGFPGPDVEDHLRRLSLQELEDLASRGNQAAVSLLAYRLAQSGGSRKQVVELLSASAGAGSVYALKTAGDIFMGVDGFRDPTLARAYYGLQARAGDQSGFEQSYLLSNLLDSTQRLKSDLMEERLWLSMEALAQSRAGQEPRPGFNEFVAQASGPAPPQ